MNEIIELELTGIAHGGAAIGRHQGRVVFVHHGLPGELVRARITADRDRFVSAVVTEVLRPSPDRVEAPCHHFGPGLCGGCQWQAIRYERQLALKQEIVRDQFSRIGRFDRVNVQPVIPSFSQWGYRSSMTFTALSDQIPTIETGEDGEQIGDEATSTVLGLPGDEGGTIIPIDRCLLLDPALDDLYQELSLGAPEIASIGFRTGGSPEDCMLILQTVDDLPPEIGVDFPVSVNFLLSDNEPANLIGSAQVHYHVFDRVFCVTAGAFFPVNAPMAEVLVREVIDILSLTGDESILECYSGVGLFTAFLAERADYLLSIESYPPAVTDADANLVDLENIDLVEGSVEDVLADLDDQFDVVFVNPPHSGLSAPALRGILALKPPRIVYVSSDPASLARDCRQFCDKGYRLVKVQPVDMSPQTYHIETVVLMSAK